VGHVRAIAGDSGMRRLFLLGLVLVLLAIGGMWIYGRWAGPTTSSPVAGFPEGAATARQAFSLAAGQADQWQDDAGLAAVSCHWPAAGMQADDQVTWAFQFFSPSTQRLAFVMVTDGAARLVREGVSPYVVPTLSTEEWRVDSDQALRVWWERKGKALAARRSDIDLTMQLRASDGGGRPVWVVVGMLTSANTAYTVMVDATDGAVVEP